MNTARKWLAVIFALILIWSMTGTVFAAQSTNAEKVIRQMINYYLHYQESAATDIDCLVYELSERNPAQAETWASIMEYWTHVNTDMTLHPDVLPDGLPQDDSLCIVVLGYALSSDGSMRKELIGRLETALASAQKYPNAYIACSGGGTASNNRTVTEAGQMASWLMDHGIGSERIIVEDMSMSTVGNAINTCKILAEVYPHVTHLALVTSDYHMARSCLLFHAQSLISFDRGSPLLCIAANAAYPAGKSTSESIDIQADNLAQLANVAINGMSKPQLSKLERIEVYGNTRFEADTVPDLETIAYYHTGLFRDVSKHVTYADIDHTQEGLQDMTVIYREGDTRITSVIQIDLIVPETQPPTQVPTNPPAEETQPPEDWIPAQTPASEAGFKLPPWSLAVGILSVLLLVESIILVRLVKILKRKKAEKAAAEEDRIDLPDDDSPIEYI